MATAIEYLASHGLKVTAQGESLLVEPRRLLTDELRQFIRAHKPVLLRLLATPGVIKPKLAASKDHVLPTPKCPTVYKVTVAGKRMTVIDPKAESYDKFVRSIYTQFGVDRVEVIEKQ